MNYFLSLECKVSWTNYGQSDKAKLKFQTVPFGPLGYRKVMKH